MGPDKQNPIDELKRLDQQIELVNDLAGLKPIFFRLEEIAKQNVNDFEVQLEVGDLKQHLVNRGTRLKEMKDAKPMAPPPPAPPPFPAVPEPPRPTGVAPPSPPPPAPPAFPTTFPTTSGLPTLPSIPTPPPPPAPPREPQGPWATTENAPLSSPMSAPLSSPMSGPPPQVTTRTIPIPAGPPTPPASPLAGGPPAAKPPAAKAPVKPPAAKPPVSRSPAPPSNWKRPVTIGGLIALVLVIGLAAGVAMHKRRLKQALLTAPVQVDIMTTPAGASIRVGGDPRCTSTCSLNLAPGSYQITAFLDGYEPAASAIDVGPGQPASISLNLEPQAQSLRILTDLDQGKVALDDQPPADLQDGQFIIDHVMPGTHTAKITTKSGEVSFSFEIADAKPPSITSPVAARNLNAVLVASLSNQAHVVTNNGPLKLAVNGQPEADAGPGGVDLKTFQSGVDELVIGDGKDQISVKESFGPAPMLTAFLRSGVSTGTLIVSTGNEDDVHVFINNRDVGRRTQRGQLRIQTLGAVLVRVAKDGFDSPPVQSTEVKKGAETRLEFTLKAAAQFATLQVVGGTPGAEVLIDQRSLGTVGFDGGLSSGGIAPGDHSIEIRRDQYVTHRLQRTFRAGQTVTISGADAILSAIPVPVPPPAPPKPEPPPTVVRNEKAPAPPPAPKLGGMDDWEDPSAWKMESGVWVHQGKGFVPYKLPPKGVFTFTVTLVKGGGLLHNGKISWALQYMDAKDYSFYEMDNKNFWAKVMSKGKATERTHIQLKDLEKQKSFTIQIDVTPEHVVTKMFAGGEWMNLDVWAETGRDFSEGKFGFLMQGNEEIGLADFKFQPK